MLSLGLFGIEKVFLEVQQLLKGSLNEYGQSTISVDCCTDQDILEMFKIAIDEYLKSISVYSDSNIIVSKINITSVSFSNGAAHLTLNDKNDFISKDDATYRVNKIILHRVVASKKYDVDHFIHVVGEELASRIAATLESYLETLPIEGGVPFYKLKTFKISRAPKLLVLEIKPLFDYRFLYYYLNTNAKILVIESELYELLKELDVATFRNKEYVIKALGGIS